MVSLAVVADRMMLPALRNIARKYKLSRDLTGILIAIGNLVPETATTILSFLQHGVKLTEFGTATNVGSAAFSITLVPAVAVIFASKPKATGAGESQISNRQRERNLRKLKKTFTRDLFTFLITLMLYCLIMKDGIIRLREAFCLVGAAVLYVASVVWMNKEEEEEELLGYEMEVQTGEVESEGLLNELGQKMGTDVR